MALSRFSTRACVRVAGVLCACALLGCGDKANGNTDTSDAAMPAADAVLPADVLDVLERRCHECHTNPPKNFAPFPLVTWQDTQQQANGYEKGVLIYEVMQMRIHDDAFPMPPDGREMTDAERAVLDDWIDTGAKPAE